MPLALGVKRNSVIQIGDVKIRADAWGETIDDHGWVVVTVIDPEVGYTLMMLEREEKLRLVAMREPCEIALVWFYMTNPEKQAKIAIEAPRHVQVDRL
jgi:hypothetical protein